MKRNVFFPTLILIAVLLTSCAPQPAATQAVVSPAAQAPESQPAQPAQATESPALEAAPTLAAFTPRGDKLEATDPATVSLASGGVQLVEFFRFT